MACRRDSTIGVIARPVCLVCRFINSRLPQAIGFRHTYRLTPRVLGGCVSEPPANLCAPSGGAVYGVSRCPGASVWPLRCPGLGLGSPVQFLAFPFWATRLSVRFCLSSVLFCLVLLLHHAFAHCRSFQRAFAYSLCTCCLSAVLWRSSRLPR